MMTAHEFREAIQRLDMKQKQFAKMTGYTEESISRYARGKKPIPVPLAVILGQMLQRASVDA